MLINKNHTEYSIPNKDGEVEFLFKAGTDMVASTMTLSSAYNTIMGGKVKEVSGDYNLSVDGKYFFKADKRETAVTDQGNKEQAKTEK